MMSEPVRVGEIEVFAISDGRLTSDPAVSFPGTETSDWEAFRDRYPTAFTEHGSWHNNLGVFFLRTPTETVMVDTGIGPGPVEALGGVRGALPNELDRLGIDPADVDIVFFTHLHPDHVGWTFGADGDAPLFTNARHCVHRADWDHFTKPESGEPSAVITRSVLPLEGSGQLDLLDGDTDLASGIAVFHAPGHTPGHMSALATSREQEIFISGDLIHHPAQVERTQWSHRADLDADQSGEHRAAWLDRVEASGALWATGHFPPPSIGTLERSDGRPVWRPVR